MNIKIRSIVLLITGSILLGCTFIQSLMPTPNPTLLPLDNPAQCDEFGLTPEECANIGTHEYSTSTQILFDVDGQTCLTEDENITVSIEFINPDVFLYVDSFDTELEYSKTGPNRYEGEYVQPNGEFEWKNKLTFTQAGFVLEASSYHIERNKHLCTFLSEQKFVSDTVQSTPIPAPELTPASGQNLSVIKDEIVEFMVDYILKNEIEAMIEIINKENIPQIEEPPAKFIIVFSPISQPVSSDYSNLMNALDTKNAEQVWVHENGELSIPASKQKAIEEYQEFIQNAPEFPSIFMWGYNEFGIVSISNDGQEAEVYLAASCGSLCGHGVILVLAKNENGQWEIKETKPIWVS